MNEEEDSPLVITSAAILVAWGVDLGADADDPVFRYWCDLAEVAARAAARAIREECGLD